ncbi:MAG: hypothetical protein COB67_00325 [SAR324 cluster bacterium]|uniref:Uncharacterized protein n=1 Tax=SAR324 cluster bacterium TaxID=2024889 RepID=A0A2A4TCT2_9DELT|nr:MAG: hypothetical protein COB67_00325 [SAR324 cluster bacterium]
MKHIIFILMISIFLYAEDEEVSTNFSDHALQTPISNFANADWNTFSEETVFTLEPLLCGDGLSKAIGFKAHMIEPVGFIEITNTPGRLLTIDIELFDINNWYDWGAVDEDDVGRQSQTHYVSFPILGMLSQGKLSSIYCFTGGDLSLAYMTELNLVRKSLAVRLTQYADMLQLFTLPGFISSIFDCMATEIDQAKGFKIGSGEGYTLRNNFYMFNGCLGAVPLGDMGGDTGDPLSDGLSLSMGMMNDMFTMGQFKKTTNWSVGPDSMCSEERVLRNIDAQWRVQLFYPVVGEALEAGLTPLDSTNFKNVPQSMDDVVYLLWKRRDYAMGAYSCPNNASSNR